MAENKDTTTENNFECKEEDIEAENDFIPLEHDAKISMDYEHTQNEAIQQIENLKRQIALSKQLTDNLQKSKALIKRLKIVEYEGYILFQKLEKQMSNNNSFMTDNADSESSKNVLARTVFTNRQPGSGIIGSSVYDRSHARGLNPSPKPTRYFECRRSHSRSPHTPTRFEYRCNVLAPQRRNRRRPRYRRRNRNNKNIASDEFFDQLQGAAKKVKLQRHTNMRWMRSE